MSMDLIMQLVDELLDPDFATRKHYSRSTYKDGCRGPLCRKSERDRATKKRQRLNPDRKVQVRNAELVEVDGYLDEVIDILGLRVPEPETVAS